MMAEQNTMIAGEKSVVTVENQQPATASVNPNAAASQEPPATGTTGTSPVLAEIKLQEKPTLLVKRDDGLVKAPDTTVAEDARAASQQRVNLIWETTQGVIAIAVTGAVIYSSLKGIDSQVLGNAFTLIVAIYFVRMNHVKTGGVGGESAGARQ